MPPRIAPAEPPPLTGTLLPVVRGARPKLAVLRPSVVLFVFMGCHLRRGHIEAPWTSSYDIRDDRLYARTRDGVYLLTSRSRGDLARRLSSDVFWSAFTTLRVNIKEVSWFDRNGAMKTTTHVKRVGFSVMDFAEGKERDEWITLSRPTRGPFTRYIDGR